MVTLIVKIDVKPEYLSEFLEETRKLRNASLFEDGCLHYNITKTFDNKIVLIEEYESDEANETHKNTDHFKTWRENVQPFMNSPRETTKCYLID